MLRGLSKRVVIVPAVTLFLSVFAATAQPEWDPGPEQYDVKVKINVTVPMRDGVNLSADIYRPDAPGKYPCLLLRTYWGNNIGPLKVPWGLYFALGSTESRWWTCEGATTPRVSGNPTSMSRRTARLWCFPSFRDEGGGGMLRTGGAGQGLA